MNRRSECLLSTRGFEDSHKMLVLSEEKQRLLGNVGARLKSRVQLKIEICQEILQIFVYEARLLKALDLDSNFSKVFAKATVIPNDDSHNVNETKAVPRSSHVIFNQSLIYHILPGDNRKRLYVEVCGKDDANDHTELIGCLSFGMKHLVEKTKKKKTIQGWFYLLNEFIGRRKHIEWPAKPKIKCSKKSCNASPANMQDKSHLFVSSTSTMTRLQIVLEKNSSDCGFSLKGSHPVIVGEIKPNSGAARSGLATGDRILCVNNRDVSRASAINVAKLINSSSRVLVLDVSRLNNTMPSSDAMADRPQRLEDHHFLGMLHSFPSLKRISCSSHRRTMSSQRAARDQEFNHAWTLNLQESEVFVNRSNQLEDRVYQEIDETTKPCVDKTPTSQNRSLFYKKSLLERTLPDSGVSSGAITAASELDNGFLDTSNTDTSVRKAIWEPSFGLDKDSFCVFSPIRGIANCDWVVEHLDTENVTFQEEPTFESISNRLCNEAFILMDHNSQNEIDASNNVSSIAHDVCDIRLHQFISHEEKFVASILNGVQKFSRPLRHCILSRQHHATLFQNIEKLMLLSEFNLQRLRDVCSCDRRGHVKPAWKMIASHFSSKLNLLIGAYGQYIAGLPSSLQMLQNLNDCPQFVNFIQSAKADLELTIEEFLQLPVQHLQQLILLFQALVGNACDKFNQDFEMITDIITTLTDLLQHGSEKENYKLLQTWHNNGTTKENCIRKNENADGVLSFKENINPRSCSIQRTTDDLFHFDGYITRR